MNDTAYTGRRSEDKGSMSVGATMDDIIRLSERVTKLEARIEDLENVVVDSWDGQVTRLVDIAVESSNRRKFTPKRKRDRHL